MPRNAAEHRINTNVAAPSHRTKSTDGPDDARRWAEKVLKYFGGTLALCIEFYCARQWFWLCLTALLARLSSRHVAI